MAWREWGDVDLIEANAGCIEDSGVLDQIEALHSPKVEIGTSTYFVEQTRALTAIDVNTGGDTSLAAGLKANILMARDLPRQLRLRGIGGQIVIDPAPMPKKDRKVLDSALKTAFRNDDVQTHVLGWTALGLIELQRARNRAPFVM
jgi:Rne/Rng family ribonuclease